LQSTLEYLLLKGDTAVAQHEIAVLAHNHDVILAAMTDERQVVIAATRRAWLGQKIDDVLPQFDLEQASGAIRERRAGMATDPNGDALLGYAGILLGGERDELRPSRTGSLFLAYDLKRYKAEARAQVVQQSLYWAGWVTALALAMWLAFHFLLTRRTERLVRAAEEARRGQSVRAQPLARHRRARPSEPRVRRDGAEGRRHTHAAAAGHRGSQAFGRSAARIRGKLPRDLRRRRGRDFPARRIGRHRRRQSQGVLDIRLLARGIPRTRGRHARHR
jgi:two-component system NtrC family sensor kinase